MWRDIKLDNKSALGKLICESLNKTKHTQKELANYCGISVSAMSCILSGSFFPSFNTLMKISAFTNISISILSELLVQDKNSKR